MSEEQQGSQQDLAERVYDPPEEFAKNANIQDPEIWDKAAEDYEGFWESWAKELHWFQEWDQVLNWEPPFAQWFVGGKTNPAYNCLDYQVEQGNGDKNALIWVGDEPDHQQTYTYNELLAEVSKFANVLKDFGIGKGDTVSIYLPRRWMPRTHCTSSTPRARPASPRASSTTWAATWCSSKRP